MSTESPPGPWHDNQCDRDEGTYQQRAVNEAHRSIRDLAKLAIEAIVALHCEDSEDD